MTDCKCNCSSPVAGSKAGASADTSWRRVAQARASGGPCRVCMTSLPSTATYSSCWPMLEQRNLLMMPDLGHTGTASWYQDASTQQTRRCGSMCSPSCQTAAYPACLAACPADTTLHAKEWHGWCPNPHPTGRRSGRHWVAGFSHLFSHGVSKSWFWFCLWQFSAG